MLMTKTAKNIWGLVSSISFLITTTACKKPAWLTPLKTYVAVIFLLLSYSTVDAQVKVFEGKETIPTYQLGADETSPIFYTGRNVQGASGHFYPYPAQIKLGEELSDVSYNMVYLENKYLKVSILPDLGGKIFSAIDKTNGHELFHTNSVIKPDFIGTLGAWISGGIEWCFPHHHRTTTFMPADYIIQKNGDGSATVWIGETERSLRLRGVIGITLHPDRSYIDVTYRLNNPNPVTKNFLFWANVAITADENFRSFWPPSHEIGVFHNNSSFTHWPISQEIYRGIDYTAGVDLTWWKNHPSPVSFFFWGGEEGFIGGYDYSQNAGTIHVGDVYENSTSKLWQFGPGLRGQNARRKLTDDGKAYVELMTGTFSHNQPDYGWFSPHSVKDAKNYWYPIKDIEIAKNATIDAAVTLQMRNPTTVFYGFNTTREFKNAKLILKYKGKEVVSKIIDIDPANPFTATWTSEKPLDEYELYTELSDENGNNLVSYSPFKPKNPKLPEPQEKVKNPEEIESVEDLYLAGRFVEQFSRPNLNADDYYLEALKRSPNDYRVNLALGISRVQQWRYSEAEEFLLRAAEKLKTKYIQPKDGELFYHLALVQRNLGKTSEANRNFHQATWYYNWYSNSYYQLAQMESIKGDYHKALEYIENAYSTNNNDGGILVLYSALLRKLERKQEAHKLMDKLIEFDPLNFTAYYEKELLNGNTSLNNLHNNMQDVDNNYLEIATNYLNAGMHEDAITLLSGLENPQNPLVYYYLAYFYNIMNHPVKAEEMLSAAQTLSFDYCFPYRQETEKILDSAIDVDHDKSKAFYLLGNLLYDKRPGEAISAWESAINIDKEMPMVWRNLAFGSFYYNKNVSKAIEHQTKAISSEPDNPIWYAELAKYYDASERDFKECLAILEAHVDIVMQDVTAPKELVKLFNLNGEYDKAIDLLKTHHFRTWEGGRNIYWYYVNAHTLKALQLLKNEKYNDAILHLESALLYPENLEVGKPLNDERNALIYFVMGQVYEKMNNNLDANKFYDKCVSAINSSEWSDLLYYQGIANKKIGNEDLSAELFNNLTNKGNEIVESNKASSGNGVEESKNRKALSNGYYLQALGVLGKGDKAEAEKLLIKSLDAYKNNLWARYFLENEL